MLEYLLIEKVFFHDGRMGQKVSYCKLLVDSYNQYRQKSLDSYEYIICCDT